MLACSIRLDPAFHPGLESPESHLGIITNVSEGGMFIESGLMMDENRQFDVQIASTHDLPVMLVHVTLVHWTYLNPQPDPQTSHGCGVRVEEPSPEFLELISRVGDSVKDK